MSSKRKSVMEKEVVIEVKELCKSYSGETVLDIPELLCYKGESLGIVGNNGAGKTTFFQLLLDLIAPDSGMLRSKGIEVAKSEAWKSFTGSYLDEGFLIDYLTPEEYFAFIARLAGISREDLQQKLEKYEDFFQGEVLGRKKYIRDLSKGNQKKVGIAGALMGDPEVLILDEPFANLDPSTQYQLRDYLQRLDRETDMTLLISSHDLGHVTEFCQRIVILDHGQVVKDLRTHPQTLEELKSFFTEKIKH